MKSMQSLQPMVAKLKEKHKDNPQKMNKEMMELYKEHKVNPLGGCLPMLLQMPVFIGLYQVLWRSVSFKGGKTPSSKDAPTTSLRGTTVDQLTNRHGIISLRGTVETPLLSRMS